MKRFWKRYKLLVLTLLVLTLFVGSTYAYLIATDASLTNIFNFARIDTQIEERTGVSKKEVVVKNEGISPVFVRARVLVSGGEIGVPPNNVTFIDGAPDENTPAPEGNVIWVYCNKTNWTWDTTDGWCYYRGVLAPDASTQELIYAVYVGTEVEGTSFKVDVYEESALTSAETFDLETAQAAFASKPTP